MVDASPQRRLPLSESDAVIGWLCVGVLSLVAVFTATIAVLWMPPVFHPAVAVRFAASFALAVPGSYLIALYAVRASGARAGGAVPAVPWVATLLMFLAGRPEGDSAYLLASWQGLLLAPAGLFAFAAGIAIGKRRPWPEGAGTLRGVQAPERYADS